MLAFNRKKEIGARPASGIGLGFGVGVGDGVTVGFIAIGDLTQINEEAESLPALLRTVRVMM